MASLVCEYRVRSRIGRSTRIRSRPGAYVVGRASRCRGAHFGDPDARAGYGIRMRTRPHCWAPRRAFAHRLGVCCDRSAWMLSYLRPFPTFSSPISRMAPPAWSSTSGCRGRVDSRVATRGTSTSLPTLTALRVEPAMARRCPSAGRHDAFETGLPLRRRRKTPNRNACHQMFAKTQRNHRGDETPRCRMHSLWDFQSLGICCS